MRKRQILLLAVPLALALTGCSGSIERRAMEASGIYDDPGCVEYREAVESGGIETEGEYSGDSREAAEFLAEREREAEERGVRVAFASNSGLTVKWYTDRERTSPIEGATAELPAGTAIYAGVSVAPDPVSDKYVFDGFRVMTRFRGGATDISSENAAEDGFVCLVPSDPEAESMTILPLGRYDDRVLTLKAQRLTPEGARETFTGEWRVNSETASGGNVRIGSASEYAVEYDYRGLAESYYPVLTQAVPAGAVDRDGVVAFPMQSPNGGAEAFSLLFRPYIRGTVTNGGYMWLLSQDIISRVAVNGAELDSIKGEKLDLGRLRVGDTVVLRVKSGYRVLADGLQVTGPVETDSGKSAEYTVTVPEDFYGLECSIEVTRRDGEIEVPSPLPRASMGTGVNGR